MYIESRICVNITAHLYLYQLARMLQKHRTNIIICQSFWY